MKYSLFVFVAGLIFCMVSSALAQSEQELARKVHEAVEKIAAMRMERLSLQQGYREQLSEIETQTERLQGELGKTEAKVSEEQRTVNALETQAEQDKKIWQIAKDLLHQASGSSVRALEVVKKRVTSGIPYQRRERLRQIEQILGGLRSADIKTLAAALHDGCRFFAEELRLGRTITLWNEPVTMEDGRWQKHAYQVRLGLVNQFFISEDGQTICLAAQIPNQDWQAADLIQAQQLQAILAILQRRRPPQVISVPAKIFPYPVRKNTNGATSSRGKD